MNHHFVDRDGASSISAGVAVVVDVMRAFTVAPLALHRGAHSITLVDDVEEAVRIASLAGALLFKDGRPDPRFDLHNSPRQLLDLDVAGRDIVQRTSAGTRAAVAATGAEHLLCAGLTCASATAAHLVAIEAELVTFVVSGGLDAEEDLACAEFIAALTADPSTDPDPYVERARHSAAAADLLAGVAKGYSGVDAEDVAMCLEVDRFAFHLQATMHGGRPRLEPPGRS